jgi:hypothetical protein
MRRVLCVATAALVFSCLVASAQARTHVFARTKCVGLFCAIVTEPEPRREPRPATWRRGWSLAPRPPHRHRRGRATAPARMVLWPAPSPHPAEVLAHPAGCPPVAFCGCGVARFIFGRIDGAMRPLWLAANWLKFPPAAPAPGMVAVHRGGHHVLAIIDYLGDGRALAYDPNSGGQLTRRHVVSLAAYRVVDPRGPARWGGV